MLNDSNVKCPSGHRQPNIFHPVILFHDDKHYQRSIRYGDPYYRRMIQIKKEQMDQMLKANSRRWQHILQTTPSAIITNAPELMHDVADNRVSSNCLSVSTPPAGATSHGIPSSPRLSTSSASSSSSSSSTSPPPCSPSSQHHNRHRAQLLLQHGQDCYYEKHPVSSTRKGRRGNLPKSVTSILKQWLIDHCQHPYPAEEEKLDLRQQTGLTLNQISNWFINARRRILPLIIVRDQSSSPLQDLVVEEDLIDDAGLLIPRVSAKARHHKKQWNRQQQQQQQQQKYNGGTWQWQQRSTTRDDRQG